MYLRPKSLILHSILLPALVSTSLLTFSPATLGAKSNELESALSDSTQLVDLGVGSTPSPENTPIAVAPKIRKWARNWSSIAKKERKRLVRIRKSRRPNDPRLPIAKVGSLPKNSASKQVWTAYGKRAKRLAKKWLEDSRRELRLMKNPKVKSGAARWKPLALYVGWPISCWPTLQRIIARESGGNPRARNPYSGCAGLLQLHPCHGVARPFDPEVNLRVGLKLYKSSGWRPWAVY